MKVRITGSSDDTVDVEGVAGVDGCDTCAADGVHVVVDIGPTTSGIGVRVALRYMNSDLTPGCWSAELSRLAEDCPIIPARVGEGDRGGYDIGVEVDVPAGTPVKVYRAEGDMCDMCGEGVV